MTLPRYIDRLTLRHLRLVIAVGNAGTLVGAAAILNVTQPTITKALQEAEALVEVELLERTNRGVVATTYGTALLHHAKLVMAQLVLAAEELGDLKDGTGGRVTVGTLLAASARLLPDAIAMLHRDRPRLSVVVVEGTNDRLMPALRVGEIDLVVGRLPEYRERQGLVQEVLFTDFACVVVGTPHPLARRKKLQLSDLVDCRWILPRTETTLRRQLDKDFRNLGCEPPINAIESVSLVTNRRLIQCADYVSVWPHEVAREDEKRGAIAILPVKLASTIGPVGISTRAQGRLSPSALALIEALRHVARRLGKKLRGAAGE